VLFAPAYSAPLAAPCPVALAIHDVSFSARPDWYAPREGLRRRVLTHWSARRARIILTISEFSRQEIVSRLAQPPHRVRVTYPGTRRPLARPSAAREPLVLFVGSIFPRRHVGVLVDAFAGAVAPAFPDARLEIVGENRLPAGTPLAHGLADTTADVQARVRFRSYVDEDALEDLYGRAAVFVFLSEYEGFGLTPLEAMARGAVPVVLDTPVAREVLGDAARYVALGPALRQTLGRTLVELLGDGPGRAALQDAAPAVLSRYDWARTAAETLAVLEEAAGAR
jgi:glycosyltransferase involved in cell wall biosynthesis